jgi:hypothetical protein
MILRTSKTTHPTTTLVIIADNPVSVDLVVVDAEVTYEIGSGVVP